MPWEGDHSFEDGAEDEVGGGLCLGGRSGIETCRRGIRVCGRLSKL